MVNKHTKNMMAMLPAWMKMAKDPASIGATFLDTFGVELGDMEKYVDEIWNSFYIGAADLRNADFCYKVPLALRDVVNTSEDLHVRFVIKGVRTDCRPAETLRLFYETDDNVYMVDEPEGFVYIKVQDYFMKEDIFHPFDAIEVGDALSLIHI